MIFGHDGIVSYFENLIRENRLSHAYLFYGNPHIGKRTVANYIARFLEMGIHDEKIDVLLDTLWVEKGDESSIGIDSIREVKRFIFQTPLRSPKRLVIVDEAHYLTREAQGALLKIIEEPPVHGLLFLITHDVNFLFPPIVSRLQRIYFKRLPHREIVSILMEYFSLPEREAQTQARNSFGSIGRIINFLGGGTSVPSVPEEDLVERIERDIMKLWNEDVVRNASRIKHLLQKLVLARQLNLNQNLQKKALGFS